MLSEISLIQDTVGSRKTWVQAGGLRLILLTRWGPAKPNMSHMPRDVIPHTALPSPCATLCVLCLHLTSHFSLLSQTFPLTHEQTLKCFLPHHRTSLHLPALRSWLNSEDTVLPDHCSIFCKDLYYFDNHALWPHAPPLIVPAKCPLLPFTEHPAITWVSLVPCSASWSLSSLNPSFLKIFSLFFISFSI